MKDGRKRYGLNLTARQRSNSMEPKVTSDAGLLPFQELDEVLGMTDMVADILTDTRIGPGKDVSPLPGMLPPSH